MDGTVDRRSVSRGLGQQPLRRVVFLVCVATWLVRALYLSVPDPLSIDEVSALTASEYGTASTFMATSDWAERWDISNHFRQWHILWIAPHAVWGYLFASNGQMAYAFTALTALVAMLALAGAAGHLFGERGSLLCLLLTSLSPLFLNYTVRALGTMPAVMWLTLALFLLTSPRCGLWGWIGGGLCFGLAFGASFGAGAAVVAIAAGLGVSAGVRCLRAHLSVREWTWACAVFPGLGALAALLPLVPVELSARYAGGDYSAFLLHHTMLVLGAWLGPYGLWLREMLELDPLLEVALLVTIVYALRSPALGRRHKMMLGFGALVLGACLVTSTEAANTRVFVSLGLFAAVGVVVVVTRVLERSALGAPALADDIPETPGPAAPFDRLSLAVSVAILVVLLTSWRNLSNMPRLSFPAWPLLVLGLVGCMLRVLPSYHATVRGTALLGSLLFIVGAAATFHAKSAHTRARVFAAQRPYWREVTYQDLWTNADLGKNFGGLSTRARAQVEVFGPPAELYPASCYEEDPYKILIYRQALRSFALDDTLAAEDIFWASIFFEPSRRAPLAPPPGTPDAPADVRALDTEGLPFVPRIHPYRGIELRFPPRLSRDRPAEMVALVAVPAAPGQDSVFGFEYEAIAPYMPADARLALSAFQGKRELGSVEIAPVVTEGRQADRALSLYEPPRRKSDAFQVVQFPIHPTGRREAIRIVARLAGRPGYNVPLSLYIRRLYVDRP